MTASRAGVLCIAVCLSATVARAAEVTVIAGVRVVTPACPITPLWVPAFIDSLRVELAGGARGPGTTLVTLAIAPCDPATSRVRVGVSGDGGLGAAERDIDLQDIAREARPRALALAVAELVRPGRGAAAAPSVAEAPVAVPAPAAPSSAAPGGLTTGIAADALMAAFPNRDTWLLGGRLSGLVDLRRWSLGVFGEAAAGGRHYDVGEIDLQSFGVGGLVGPRWRAGQFTLSPAFVGVLGLSRIQGHAGAPGVIAGSGVGATVALRARFAVSSIVVRAAVARAFLEGGWMARGFDAKLDGARVAGVSGATLVVGLGLGF